MPNRKIQVFSNFSDTGNKIDHGGCVKILISSQKQEVKEKYLS